jgi:hypothetical protein
MLVGWAQLFAVGLSQSGQTCLTHSVGSVPEPSAKMHKRRRCRNKLHIIIYIVACHIYVCVRERWCARCLMYGAVRQLQPHETLHLKYWRIRVYNRERSEVKQTLVRQVIGRAFPTGTWFLRTGHITRCARLPVPHSIRHHSLHFSTY